MPRVSLEASDSVCRVPKPTSLRTVASMRCAEMLASIAFTSAGVGFSGDAVALAPVTRITSEQASRVMALGKLARNEDHDDVPYEVCHERGDQAASTCGERRPDEPAYQSRQAEDAR